MDAIVSLLDEVHCRRLELLWDELRDRFGLTTGFATRYPHFSYLSAENITHESIDFLLEPLANEARPLTVTTAGLGYFPGPTPVIHLPIVRTFEIGTLHRKIWESCATAEIDPRAQFSPETWIPHITLALDGLSEIDPMSVFKWLTGLDLEWSIEIDNLAVITSAGERRRFAFGSGDPVESQPVE